MFLFIIGVIIIAGLFNPYTGLFGNTFYSPKTKEKIEKECIHYSFKLTR